MQYSLGVHSFAVNVAWTSYKTAARKHGVLAVVFLTMEVWLEAILSHLMTSNTLKRFWGWGRFLSCWLFSRLSQCSFLSCWIFRMLDWLKCCVWMRHDKTSTHVLGSKSLSSGKWLIGKKTGGREWWSASSFYFVHFLLVFWEQVGPLYQVYSCNCFRILKCVQGEILLLFHSTFFFLECICSLL